MCCQRARAGRLIKAPPWVSGRAALHMVFDGVQRAIRWAVFALVLSIAFAFDLRSTKGVPRSRAEAYAYAVKQNRLYGEALPEKEQQTPGVKKRPPPRASAKMLLPMSSASMAMTSIMTTLIGSVEAVGSQALTAEEAATENNPFFLVLGVLPVVAGGAFFLVRASEDAIKRCRADPANADRLGYTEEEVCRAYLPPLHEAHPCSSVPAAGGAHGCHDEGQIRGRSEAVSAGQGDSGRARCVCRSDQS